MEFCSKEVTCVQESGTAFLASLSVLMAYNCSKLDDFCQKQTRGKLMQNSTQLSDKNQTAANSGMHLKHYLDENFSSLKPCDLKSEMPSRRSAAKTVDLNLLKPFQSQSLKSRSFSPKLERRKKRTLEVSKICGDKLFRILGAHYGTHFLHRAKSYAFSDHLFKKSYSFDSCIPTIANDRKNVEDSNFSSQKKSFSQASEVHKDVVYKSKMLQNQNTPQKSKFSLLNNKMAYQFFCQCCGSFLKTFDSVRKIQGDRYDFEIEENFSNLDSKKISKTMRWVNIRPLKKFKQFCRRKNRGFYVCTFCSSYLGRSHMLSCLAKRRLCFQDDGIPAFHPDKNIPNSDSNSQLTADFPIVRRTCRRKRYRSNSLYSHSRMTELTSSNTKTEITSRKKSNLMIPNNASFFDLSPSEGIQCPQTDSLAADDDKKKMIDFDVYQPRTKKSSSSIGIESTIHDLKEEKAGYIHAKNSSTVLTTPLSMVPKGPIRNISARKNPKTKK